MGVAPLDTAVFSLVAGKIREAGSCDPREVARFFDILWVDLKGSIPGYASLYNGVLPVIGLHVSLKGVWYRLVGWHELTHIFAGHVRESDFGRGHADFSFFLQEVDSQALSRQEKTANLVAADVSLPDADVLEVTGYLDPTLRSYRHLKSHQEQLLRELDALRFLTGAPSGSLRAQMRDLQSKLRDVGVSLSEMEETLMALAPGRTFDRMAAELEVTPCILRYKLEAMRIRGLDVDRQELERYDRVFSDVI